MCTLELLKTKKYKTSSEGEYIVDSLCEKLPNTKKKKTVWEEKFVKSLPDRVCGVV